MTALRTAAAIAMSLLREESLNLEQIVALVQAVQGHRYPVLGGIWPINRAQLPADLLASSTPAEQWPMG